MLDLVLVDIVQYNHTVLVKVLRSDNNLPIHGGHTYIYYNDKTFLLIITY